MYRNIHLNIFFTIFRVVYGIVKQTKTVTCCIYVVHVYVHLLVNSVQKKELSLSHFLFVYFVYFLELTILVPASFDFILQNKSLAVKCLK